MTVTTASWQDDRGISYKMLYLYATRGCAAAGAEMSKPAERAGTEQSSTAASWPPVTARAPCASGKAATAVTGPRCNAAVLLRPAPAAAKHLSQARMPLLGAPLDSGRAASTVMGPQGSAAALLRSVLTTAIDLPQQHSVGAASPVLIRRQTLPVCDKQGEK